MAPEPDATGASNETGAEHAGGGLQRRSVIEPEAGPPSPFRILFAIVPLMIIVVVGAHLVWTGAVREPAREKALSEPEPRLAEKSADAPAENATAPVEPSFNAAAVVARLANADPTAGAAAFRMCAPCHSGEKNAPPKLAPNLWGIVGRAKAATPGYAYSSALKSKGGTWTYEELAEFLHNPRQFAPGTSMAFAGIRTPTRMADLIAHLRALSDAPAPLPGQRREP